jgi:alanine racemase
LPKPLELDILDSMNPDGHTAWLEIDLEAIKHNIRQLRAIAQAPVMAVVKANGYGHGIVEVARAAQSAGAAWCGVARIEEALALRQANLAIPTLVMGFAEPQRIPEAIHNRVALCIYDLDTARAYAEQTRKTGGRLKVHAKFDSGMGRLGVFPEDGLAFIRELCTLEGLEVEGMFTHMARADDTDRETTLWQISRFRRLVEELQSEGLRPPLAHASNSASTLYFPQARFDMVRCGISIYGLHPSAEAPNPQDFQPALTWKARLTSVKYLPPGHGVGYNYRYRTQKQERIGAVSVGYADGFRRRLGNFALIHGRRVAAVGGVCMDQFMVQLDEMPEAKIGDEVVLLGQQGHEVITAEDIAAAWGTNNYEVVCGLEARLPRLYSEG